MHHHPPSPPLHLPRFTRHAVLRDGRERQGLPIALAAAALAAAALAAAALAAAALATEAAAAAIAAAIAPAATDALRCKNS